MKSPSQRGSADPGLSQGPFASVAPGEAARRSQFRAENFYESITARQQFHEKPQPLAAGLKFDYFQTRNGSKKQFTTGVWLKCCPQTHLDNEQG